MILHPIKSRLYSPGAGAAALTRKGSKILPLAGLQMRIIFVSGHDAVLSVVLLSSADLSDMFSLSMLMSATRPLSPPSDGGIASEGAFR